MTSPTSAPTRRLQRHYDRIARCMGREAEEAADKASAWRRRFWEALPTGLVLELGIGAGINLSHYAKDTTVVALDLSAAMLEEARQRNGSHGLLEADAQHLPFRDGFFEGVAASFVFCGIPNPMLALAEVRRVCKKGARVLLLEHGRGTGLLGPVMDFVDPLVMRLSGGEHINGRQQEWVREAGFTVERVDSFAWGIVQLIEGRV